MADDLPIFRYHPNPVATGNVVWRDNFVCGVCRRPREYAYIGPYYDNSEDCHAANGDEICPWCIADGSAAREWRASFIIPGYLSKAAQAKMPPEMLAELEFRTPSFLCMQQECWLDHHGEAAAFLGKIGDVEEYIRLPPQAQIAIRECVGDYGIQMLKSGGPTAYLFRCLQCDWYGVWMG
jgi:uncharacterized protein